MPTSSHRIATAMAAALLAHGSPAGAGGRQTATPIERWTVEARASLMRALAEPRPIGKPAEPAGVVDIAFGVGEDGRARRVSVLHSSGTRTLDGKAAAAVRRIRTRMPTPAEFADGRVAIARIFFVLGDRPLDDADMRDIVARTAVKNGWAERDRVAGAANSAVLLAARR